MRRSGLSASDCFIVLAFLTVLSATLFQGCSGAWGPRQYVAGKVKRVYEETTNHSTTHMVAVTCDDGTIETFKNADAFYYGKWNSSTVQNGLTVGKRYRFDVYGRRSEFWSTFRNILSAEVIDE